MTQQQIRAMHYIRNAGDATIIEFCADHDPVGYDLFSSLCVLDMVAVEADETLSLTHKAEGFLDENG